MPDAAPEAASASPNEQLWRRLVSLIDFGDRLDFALLEFSSPEILRAWSAALRARCAQRGQPWSEAPPGQSVLDWLDAERVRGLGVERALGPKRAREVYLGVIPEGNDERFVFARINENRDNLVRALNGVLCLAGPGDFIRRLAYAAPSIWAMRTETFELRELPPNAVAVPVDDEAPTQAPEHEAPSFDLDVLISAAPRDEQEATDLLRRLRSDGFSVAIALDGKGHAQLDRARIVVVLLSYSYAYSKAYEALQAQAADPPGAEALSRKLVPLLLSEGSIPGLFRKMSPLDYRSPEARARSYVKLVHSLRGTRVAGSGPGLEAYSSPILSDTQMGDLIEALLFAFPTSSALDSFVRQRTKIDGARINFFQSSRDVVRELVMEAAATGRLKDLIRAAAAERPDDARLLALAS
jgi:hypothetical protein